MDKYEIKDGVGIIAEGTTFIDYQAFSGCTGPWGETYEFTVD